MKEEPKKWNLFDIVRTYSSGVKTILKAIKAPTETTGIMQIWAFSDILSPLSPTYEFVLLYKKTIPLPIFV